ncbi:tripartite tricarboxylate transporter TctB family protein [Bacillus sp. Marseille-P3661]|uniref:tripartite tricarboxylate transporter TctB family protein n=1 Tax=Bacillus sp. Marseille-P3661 TaxID=1936234 RepID=UPI000C858D9F|nr:tripartite tricarboxylate transporter TctB family protein [Bacillus sp. Marseille-P3661]
MIKITRNGLFSLTILLFAIVIFVATLTFPNGTSDVPKMISICLIVLTLIQVLNDLFPEFKKRTYYLHRQKEEISAQEEEQEKFNVYRNHVSFAIWISIFVLLIYYINVLPSIAIALFLYLKVISKESWKLSILYSVVFTLGIYLIFVVGLGVNYFI